MGENESSRANSLALLVFTPFALQKAGGRRRIAFAVLANVPAGPRGARPKSFLTILSNLAEDLIRLRPLSPIYLAEF